MTEAEQISLLEKKEEEVEQFSQQHFDIIKKLAQLYYQQKKYRQALNRLTLLEKAPDTPKWVNLYIAASLIQSAESNYFKTPERYFFNRLKNVDPFDKSALDQRNAIFKDALHIFIENREQKRLKINFEAYTAQAERFGLNNSEEWQRFKAFYNGEDYTAENSEEFEPQEEPSTFSKSVENPISQKIEKTPLLSTDFRESKQQLQKKEISAFRRLLNGKKILIIGKMKPKSLNEWKNKAKKQLGLQEKDLDFYPDYDKCTKKLQSIQESEQSGYAAIIVGAISHSDDEIVKNWEKKEGTPYTIHARAGGKELKLTASSFFNALTDIYNHFAALPCD